MTWPECIALSDQLLSLYDARPSLDRVYLHEASLGQDGPHLRLRFDLLTFPDRPPPRWVASGFNTIQVTVGFWGLSRIAIANFALENCVSIRTERSDVGIDFAVEGTTQMGGRCTNALLQSVSGYLKNR